MIRSCVNWHEQGEKNNKYFLNLENFKKGRSVIRNLNINGTDDFTTDPKIKMKEIQEFCSDLYSERKLDEKNSLVSFLWMKAVVFQYTSTACFLLQG